MSTVLSCAKESSASSDMLDVEAGELVAARPNVVVSSAFALPEAEATPKPMHPTSTSEAQAPAAIFAAMLVFASFFRLTVKP